MEHTIILHHRPISIPEGGTTEVVASFQGSGVYGFGCDTELGLVEVVWAVSQ